MIGPPARWVHRPNFSWRHWGIRFPNWTTAQSFQYRNFTL